jgi:hypothetical protein
MYLLSYAFFAQSEQSYEVEKYPLLGYNTM